MRELKFRAWVYDESGKQFNMWYPDDLSIFFDVMIPPRSEDKDIIMQFTGLKDKNGKEIYEGDIIDVANHFKAIVFYRAETGSFSTVDIKEWNNGNVNLGNGSDHLFGINLCEVIGNKYENPELLEQ